VIPLRRDRNQRRLQGTPWNGEGLSSCGGIGGGVRRRHRGCCGSSSSKRDRQPPAGVAVMDVRSDVGSRPNNDRRSALAP